jgi:hypothetical protein
VGGTYSLLLRTGLAQFSLRRQGRDQPLGRHDGHSLDFARSYGPSTRVLIAGVAEEQQA